MRDPRPIAGSVVVAFVVGCMPATIHLSDGRRHEGFIERSDATTLWVRGEDGIPFGFGQEQVAKIDHPGDGQFIAGIFMTALGAVILREALRDDISPMAAGIGKLFGGMFVFSGVFSIGGGGATWLESRRAARPFNDARPPATRARRPH